MSRRRTTFAWLPALALRAYSERHPFKPQRAKLTHDLCARQGYLGRSWMREVNPSPADPAVLALVHTPEYLDVLRRASEGDIDERIVSHGLGMEECPLFDGLWDYCLETVGIAAQAIDDLVEDRTDIVFSPAGGMHHALPDMATGFCYVNDVAIACRLAADRGLRVAYVDLDAHHGNGVQKVFWEDPRVLVTSIHETGKTLYPWSGFVDEIGAGPGRGYTANIPVEPDTDDRALMRAWSEGLRPLVRGFKPDLIVVELGADGLSVDPLTHLRYTNNGLADVVADLLPLAPKILVTGGGGYDVKATTKTWTLAWSVLNGIEPVADTYANMGGVFLGEESLIGATLRDMQIFVSGPDRERVHRAVDEAIAALRQTVYPIVLGP